MTRTFRLSELAVPFVLAIALPVWFIARELAVAGSFGFPLDDSWIHLVFARNIARGDFFAYNPGEHVAGSTSPLWTIILAIGFFITHDPYVMPKVVGIALHVVLVWLSMRLSVLVGASRRMAVVAGMLVAAAPRLLWAADSGMEVTLACVLTVLAIDLHLRYRQADGWRAYAGWGMSGVAVWARPELMVLPVFFALHALVMRAQRVAKGQKVGTESMPVSRVLTGGGVAVIAMLPFLILNEALSGTLLPLTFYAKAAGGLSFLLGKEMYGEIIKRSFEALWLLNKNAWKWIWAEDNLFTAMIGVVALGWTIVRLVKRHATGTAGGLALLAFFVFLYPPIRGLVTGYDNFLQFSRYGAMTTPVMIIFACAWLDRVIGPGERRRTVEAAVAFLVVGTAAVAVYYASIATLGRGHQHPHFNWYLPFLEQAKPVHVIAFAAFAALGVIGVIVRTTRPLIAGSLASLFAFQMLGFSLVEDAQVATEYAWNVKNINDTQVEIGRWLAAETKPGTVYATNDIGAMAYFADKDRMLDLMGLVSKEVALRRNDLVSSDITALWLMKTQHPSLLVCFDEWFPGLIREGLRLEVLRSVHTAMIPNNLTSGGVGVTRMNVYAIDYDRLPALLALAGNRVPR